MNNPDYQCYDCHTYWSTWGPLRFCPACGSPEVIKLIAGASQTDAGTK